MSLLTKVALLVVIVASFSAAACDNQTAEWRELEGRASELSKQEQISEAIEVAQKAVAFAEEAFGPDHPNLAVSLTNLAVLYRRQGDFSMQSPSSSGRWK